MSASQFTSQSIQGLQDDEDGDTEGEESALHNVDTVENNHSTSSESTGKFYNILRKYNGLLD